MVEVQQRCLLDKVRIFLGIGYVEENKDFEIVFSQDIPKINAKRVIIVDSHTSQITMYTESKALEGNEKVWENSVYFVSRMNDFLQLGCLEILPNTFKIRLRIGQRFHPEANPEQVLDFWIKFHNQLFPSIIDSFREVIATQRSPLEAAQSFIKPFSKRTTEE
jgi:hypothetical protein